MTHFTRQRLAKRRNMRLATAELDRILGHDGPPVFNYSDDSWLDALTSSEGRPSIDELRAALCATVLATDVLGPAANRVRQNRLTRPSLRGVVL